MDVIKFCEILGKDFYCGVPDSLLKPLCDYLSADYQEGKGHIIAANEGNCTAIAAGYHLSTGKIPVVYMQNSGIGNIINPVTSLLNHKVYGIPCIFVIGWRGEPGCKDEPQHIYQGEVTEKLLEDVGLRTFVVTRSTSVKELSEKMAEFDHILKGGDSVAFVIKKDAFQFQEKITYKNPYTLIREDVIRKVAEAAGDDIIISTTGKASRELFEIREEQKKSHQYDFLTVGSMGHASSIAMGIAIHKPNTKVWCIDGDGALLMHMGSLALIGSMKPDNMIHIVIDNEAHETVGGMPTVSAKIDLIQIAQGCGYPNVIRVKSDIELSGALETVKKSGQLSMIIAKCAINSRKNLGRPSKSAKENKINFMQYLREKD